MVSAKRVVWVAGMCALLVLGALAGSGGSGTAQNSTRTTIIKEPYTEYSWWLIDWVTGGIVCRVTVDHAGLPTVSEVGNACGKSVADAWWLTPTCNINKGPCYGLYAFLAATQPKEREVVVELPMPEIWVTLEGCTPTPPTNLCQGLPTLVLTAQEPLQGYQITNVNGRFDGVPFICPNTNVCRLPLRVTPLQGSTVDFWADSTYGDSSQVFTAQVRVIDSGVLPQPGAAGWYVDVISSQWTGQAPASCAKIWEAFPPVGAPPSWLRTPDHFELMASEMPYYYLAGRLISQGLVDVSACPNGGMLPNGYADVCGLDKARPLVAEWQNQFDHQIIEVANETGVPAQLMKNLFAQESQFWPGEFRVPFEYGLGQITDQGADVILIWNPEFFQQFCPMALSAEACSRGYLGLSVDNQALLRGALAQQAKADCPDCPTGVDLSNVRFTVSLFAQTLLANCAQVSRSVYTASERMAGRVASYEDLWKLTLANYHAGPGCVSYALHQAYQSTGTLAWEEVKTRFTPSCQGVVPYVDQITR